MKEKLTFNEAILHVDFSQNYNLKVNREIQSAGFGPSKRQVSIHTGMMYVKPENEVIKIPFASVYLF